jgi:hypothetical protein
MVLNKEKKHKLVFMEVKSDILPEVDRRDVTRILGLVEVKSDQVYELDNPVITRIFDVCATALKLEMEDGCFKTG